MSGEVAVEAEVAISQVAVTPLPAPPPDQVMPAIDAVHADAAAAPPGDVGSAEVATASPGEAEPVIDAGPVDPGATPSGQVPPPPPVAPPPPPPTPSPALSLADEQKAELQRDLITAVFQSDVFTVSAGRIPKWRSVLMAQEFEAALELAPEPPVVSGQPPQTQKAYEQSIKDRIGKSHTPAVASVAVLEKLAAQLKVFVAGDAVVDSDVKGYLNTHFYGTPLEPLCDAVWTAAVGQDVTYKELKALGIGEDGLPFGRPLRMTMTRRVTAVVAAQGIPNGDLSNNYISTITLLRRDKYLTGGGKIEWNVMSGQIELNRVEADEVLLLGRVLEDLATNYTGPSRSGRGSTQLEPAATTLERALAHEAMEHPYHPTRDWFEKIRRSWDGVDYLVWVAVLIGAEPTELVLAQLRNFFIGMVARTYDPGCQMDTCLTLNSPQGTKKSTFFREIAPAGRFSSTAMDLENKDSLMQMQMFSLVELAEMVGLSSKTSGTIKSFITQRSDDFRTPYGRVLKVHPRHAVLCCTTNDPQFKDPTGSRRFDTVTITGMIDIKTLRLIRDQLWAQAIHLYFAAETCAECKAQADEEDRCPAHRWWLGKELAAQREVVNAKDTVDLPCVEWLERFFQEVRTGIHREKQGFHPEAKTWRWDELFEVTTPDLVEAMYGLEHREDHKKKLDMAAALKKSGYVKVQGTIGKAWRSPDWTNKTKAVAAWEAEAAAKKATSLAVEARYLADEEERTAKAAAAEVINIRKRKARAVPPVTPERPAGEVRVTGGSAHGQAGSADTPTPTIEPST